MARAAPPVAYPPAEYMRLVCGDVDNLEEEFERVGRALVRGLGRVKILGSQTRLLDIGCGCGRVARYLLDSPIAAYSGFDRHPGMIEWAQAHIGSRDERFMFRYVEVQSSYEELDGRQGSVSATEFVFPYAEGAFSGALAASVFTHIDFPATCRYLRETARVLAEGGAVLASYFPGRTTGRMGGSTWNFVIRPEDLRLAISEAELEVVLFDPPRSGRQNFVLLGKPSRSGE